MHGIFSAPVFADEEKTQRAQTLFALLWVMMASVTLAMSTIALGQPELIPSTMLVTSCFLTGGLVFLEMNRRGFVTAASAFFITMAIIAITIRAVNAGGIRSPGVTMFHVLALAAGLLLGARAGIATALACLGIALGLVGAEKLHLISAQGIRYTPLSYWALNFLYMSLAVVLIRGASQGMRTAFDRLNRELSERRKAEQSLQIALEAGAIGVWQWSPESGALLWDERMYEIYEIPPGSPVTYESWAARVLPDDLPLQEDMLREMTRSGYRSQREFRIRTASGTRHIYAAEQAYPSGDGPARVIGINIDITARKETEAEIRRIKNQLETLVKEARIGILVHQNFKPVEVNAELLAMFRMTEEEALGIADIRDFISEDTGLQAEKYEDRLKVLEVRTVMNARCRRKDGEWIDCEIRAFPILWEGQASICAMVTDVTHKNRLEAQLRQTQRLEAIGRMTGGVAHDFNNLLTIILGNAEVMEKRLQDDEVMAELAGMTRQAAEQGAELTGRLLAFSRQQALSIKPTNIGALVEGMSGLIQRVLNQDIELRMVIDPGLWVAAVDVAQLESALLNLAINSRDAMPSGGLLTIEVANVRLSEADLADQEQVTQPMPGSGAADYVMVAISDTGIGMDEKTRLRLFEPFFTTKGIGKGSGLGLPMVYGFISQLGGQIRVYSEPGDGASIRLYLPRAETDEAVEVEVDDAPLAGGSEKILLVEDHDLVRRQVETQLKTLGYRVVCARDGFEALEILRTTGDFDLLFTDVMMPRMSGTELAREASLLRPGLPVLFTSGYTDNALAHQGRLDPSVNLLTKPYRRDVLAAKLRYALDRSRRKRSDSGA